MKVFSALVIVLCLLAGCSYLAYQRGYEQGVLSINAQETVEINRSPQVIYPEDQYQWGQEPVYIYWSTEDTHYHGHFACPFAISAFNGALKISNYEAVERGYQPCVNCVYPEVFLP